MGRTQINGEGQLATISNTHTNTTVAELAVHLTMGGSCRHMMVKLWWGEHSLLVKHNSLP